MDNNLVNLADLENALAELGDVTFSEDMMTDEMRASEQRCQQYIEKHFEQD